MYKINHNDAVKLEWQVRRLYNCERSGVYGMVDADCFERHPMLAAVLVVTYIHVKGLEADSLQYDDFLCKYEIIFENPEENNAENKVDNYIMELEKIIDSVL